jgi:hypothetical protein
MKRFKVSYEDADGDLSHVWVDANDEAGARASAKREYWDCENIIQVVEMIHNEVKR